MNPVLQDFCLDLDRLRRIFSVSQALIKFRSCTFEPVIISDEILKQAVSQLHAATQAAHAEMPILNGVLLLYLAGRFENFVREIFEDLSDTIAGQCGQFAHLPRKMQENLTKFTAEVIANPRKYGHGDNGVIAFVTTMADNLNGRPLAGVNSKCLSITSENMWPDTLSEVFARIGATTVWERLGQQASVQTFFHVDQPDKATSEAKKFLTEFMKLRNQIAHPSGDLMWPSMELSMQHIEFCDVVSRALADVCAVWALTLGTRQLSSSET
ncbi:MAG: HEPN domain-containing protein [Syntrophobacteraceae bacterium]